MFEGWAQALTDSVRNPGSHAPGGPWKQLKYRLLASGIAVVVIILLGMIVVG